MNHKKKHRPWYGYPGGWFAWWYSMQTQPLIFDDSMSLLQKAAAIWHALRDLSDRVDTLEDDDLEIADQIDTIQTTVAGQGETIDHHTGQITAVALSVEEIQMARAGELRQFFDAENTTFFVLDIHDIVTSTSSHSFLIWAAGDPAGAWIYNIWYDVDSPSPTRFNTIEVAAYQGEGSGVGFAFDRPTGKIYISAPDGFIGGIRAIGY